MELNTDAQRHAEMKRCENRGVKVILRRTVATILDMKIIYYLIIHHYYPLMPH